ncbi:MAG TPA: family 78 glycoside hydrolase catalytic domain [Acidobacteriaceae bacterium]|jgi:alpha-L-rhamnosidase|nr:family 78 glycoside hydrolase catalytic domain [Acidobacteriaceae bacterium]
MTRRDLIRFFAIIAAHCKARGLAMGTKAIAGKYEAGISGALPGRDQPNPIAIDALRCEYRENPLGIDILKPRLSWTLHAGNRRGVRQTAYRILVASSPALLRSGKADLWDTEKIKSNHSTHIEYQGKALRSRMQCYWKVQVWDESNHRSGWSQSALWTVGLLNGNDWHASWIGLEEDSNQLQTTALPMPRYLRKEFTIEGKPFKATAYVTAAGLYQLHLNGQKVGKHILAPEWTDYHKRIQYDTLDVTSLLVPGRNAIGTILGNGWYCGLWQCWPPRVGIYGKQPHLLMQLEIEYADGRRQRVLSDPSWRGSTDGPIRFAGIYEGETYDARMEMPGWDKPGFDESLWRPVEADPSDETRKLGRPIWQRSEPIQQETQFVPVSVTEPKPEVYVFDMGQNMVGWCRLNVDLPAGSEITLLHNEVLNPDGTVYMDNLHAGHLSSGDRQILRYTGRGGSGQIYEPHFTYMGFRYVELRGFPQRPEKEMLTGIVFHTSAKMVGSFSCSHELVNQLVHNIQWSLRGNLMGVPTDCPSRDERCGYTGDSEFIMPTAVYNVNLAAFLNKWLVDLCEDSQFANGGFPDMAPDYKANACPNFKVEDNENVGWGDGGIISPYIMFQTYGDVRVLRDHYPAMQRYAQMLIDTSHGYTRGPEHVGFGDWLNLGGNASDAVLGTVYYAYIFMLMTEIAQVLGKSEDATAYRDRSKKISQTFVDEFVDGEGKIKGSSQTGYALVFAMGLVPPNLQQKMSHQFSESLAAFNYHLATGLMGTSHLLTGLHAAKRDDLASRLLLTETFPSWLYEVHQGATTIWERWDGWTPDKGFQWSGMNSFNHYALGSCGEYLYSIVGGIRAGTPGYKHIIIQPTFLDGFEWATAEYKSIQGPIRCAWKRTGDHLYVSVTIPPNTTATIYLPASDAHSLLESGKPVLHAQGLRLQSVEQGVTILDADSGMYEFVFQANARIGAGIIENAIA